MASTVASLQPTRPGVAFRAGAKGRRQPAAARRHVLGVTAGIKTDAGTTSGLEINGMRPTTPRAWETISKTLKKAGVSFVTRDQAEAAVAKGNPTIVDIRPSNEFGRGRLPGSVNCQFYQPITGWDPSKIIRRIGFSAFGVYGTEANPDFLEDVAAAVPRKNGGMILVCNIGGSLEPTGPSKFGRQSRSLTAAYELVQAGFSNIKILTDGYNGWAKEEREIEID